MNCIDINGDSIIIKMSLSQDQSIQLLYNYNENSFYDQQSGSLYNPNVDAPFYAIYKTVSDAFNNLSSTSAGDEVLHDLFVSDKYVYIRASGDVNTNGENVREDYQSVVSWNPFKDSAFGGGSCYSLIHELAHSQSRFNGNMNANTWYSEETANGPVNIIYDEIYAIHVENMVRAENGAQLRTHSGKDDYNHPSGGRVIKTGFNGHQISVYFDNKGNHNIDYRKMKKNNYIYR